MPEQVDSKSTVVQVLQDVYDEQRLFRVSIPGLNAAQLLVQHLNYVKDFETRCGSVQPIFADLLAIAKTVDEYTVRQESNSGHIFLQLAGGFARSRMAQMMAENADEEDDDEDEEYALERVEYDEDEVSPLIRAIGCRSRSQPR
jgi:hypothetical protein